VPVVRASVPSGELEPKSRVQFIEGAVDELNLDLQKLAIVNAQKPAVKCYLQPMDVEKPRPQKLK